MPEDKSPTQKILRRIRKFTAPKDRTQLRELLRNAAGAGLLDADALSMVEGVLDVSDLQVRDIMVPHNQMICVRGDDLPQHILSVAIDSGHSRFPVLEPDGEKIIGILLAKDLLRLFTLNSSASFDIRDWMRKALFVPESKRVNVLLKELRMGRNHMAICVDEYGSVAGLVTIEDVIEQIIGEIDDEYDVEAEKNIRREGDRQFAVQGATRIEEFNEHFGAQFPDAEFDTIAGLVTQHFGRLPRRGEAALIEGFEFRVIRADRRRIETLRVTTQSDNPQHGSEGANDAATSDDSG
jgi:magnesium and cobalt transporter